MGFDVDIRRPAVGDLAQLRALSALFGGAFQDAASYASRPPDDAYLRDVPSLEHAVALVAIGDGDDTRPARSGAAA